MQNESIDILSAVHLSNAINFSVKYISLEFYHLRLISDFQNSSALTVWDDVQEIIWKVLLKYVHIKHLEAIQILEVLLDTPENLLKTLFVNTLASLFEDLLMIVIAAVIIIIISS